MLASRVSLETTVVPLDPSGIVLFVMLVDATVTTATVGTRVGLLVSARVVGLSVGGVVVLFAEVLVGLLVSLPPMVGRRIVELLVGSSVVGLKDGTAVSTEG